jgi:CheY-like chemotaxis protein
MSTILLAEDNAINRELLREILETRGYTVLEACDGQQALQMIEQAPPDIVLMDIGMPILDGFATLIKIRQNPRLASLPVVAVTAYAMQGDREKIINAGFDGYLSKPVNFHSLGLELDRLLARHATQSSPSTQPPEKPPATQAARAIGSGK